MARTEPAGAGKRTAAASAAPAATDRDGGAFWISPGKGSPADFSGYARAAFQRRLVLDHVLPPDHACARDRYEALALVVRDLLTERWIKTTSTHDSDNVKQVYYLSMEFLIGRSLSNNLINLGIDKPIRAEMDRLGFDWLGLIEEEPDAGLGNGGLGRLAACFLDSLATLEYPAIGYGLRYQYGMFRQEIEHGRQAEHPDNWLLEPDPWEVDRHRESVHVKFASGVRLDNGVPRLDRGKPMSLDGIPFDRPIVGYRVGTINTLRLWEASTPNAFDFQEFSHGDFFGAMHNKVLAHNLTRVLYPDDSTTAGQRLRFVQESFLVMCSLADIVARFRRRGNDWRALPDKVAIQLNDTHPAIAVAELMRILLDDAGLGWDEAWGLTVNTLAYTNHTLLPEALEKWTEEVFELFMPRQLDIIREINRRFLDDVRKSRPGDDAFAREASLFEEEAPKRVRMANLAIVGSHSTNGVAEIHSRLLRTTVVKPLAELFPERFNNKTNGVTPRRWLLLANPELSGLITEAIGPDWTKDLRLLKGLAPLAADSAFREKFRAAKRSAKKRFAAHIKAELNIDLDPELSIFDCQIKRIHAYKRQLLNVLRIIILYNRLREDPGLEVPPRVYFFAGKAAPAYLLAKLIIKFINNVAGVIAAEPAAAAKIRIVFLEDYGVSLAQRLIPAADVSEQISTAGYEASGTSNMKFMMNGALTVGTRDGATIEIAQEAGEENVFFFGLSAEQVRDSRPWYRPQWHYENDPEVRAAIKLITDEHFSRDEPGIFKPIRAELIESGDVYMHLADIAAYDAAQKRAGALYLDPDEWTKKAIQNVAHSGKFSSDRSIAEYASEIWRVEPRPIV